jgi:hypothetical protein
MVRLRTATGLISHQVLGRGDDADGRGGDG